MTTKANRVVVTGMGCVSPLGCDPETLFAKAMAGSTHFVHAPEADKTSLLSLVDDVAFRQQCCAYGLTDEASFTGYTSLALAMALHEARLIGESVMLSRAPLYIGTSNIHTDCEQHLYTDVRDVAQRHGIGGSIVLLPVACTGGNVAIALGANMIRSGRTDVAVVGGVDVYTPTAYAIFSSLGILSQRTASPFMKQRDGITIGEGAGCMVIESEAHAQRRGARVLAVVDGYNMACDAYHLTTPDPSGKQAADAMRCALHDGELEAEDIDGLCPHGTGTVANDQQEYEAMRQVFGERVSTLPVYASKGHLGHCLGAASALEAILCVKMITHQEIPSSAQLHSDVKAFPLNLFERSQHACVNHVMNNAFAFGGNICCVIFGKYEERIH